MPAPVVALLSPHRHPRLRYVLKEVGRDLGYELRLFTDPDRWASAEAAGRLTYGTPPPGAAAPHLPGHPFLAGGEPGPDLWQRPDLPAGTDRLAAIFYALCRYEEYGNFSPDRHGRFPATASHAARYGYLDVPVVRRWTRALGRELRAAIPALPAPPQRRLEFVPTYDIDLLWAWRFRGWRGLAAGFRDLATGHFSRARARWTRPAAEDPYLTLDRAFALHPRTRPRLFWLLSAGRDRHDPNPYPIPAAQRALMQALEERAEQGLHPGYRAAEDPGLLAAEAERFRDILGRSPLHSRQHFLRLRFPATYRQLRLQGITHDHSMGYADAPGWRAGTNLPFYWYDLEREEATGLLVHPFAAMDVTLKNYLGLGPAAAVAKVRELAATAAPYGGPFPLLWHNSSFAPAYGWSGWEAAYADLCARLTSGRTDR